MFLSDEEAKAVQATAKTADSAFQSAEKMGGFIASVIKGPLQQGVGIFEDKLRYYRWENQMKLMEKTQRYMRERNLNNSTKALPLKFAIPLISGASLEEDDELQDMWARLLVNAIDEKSEIDLHRTYLDILERLSPLEAKIIETIYSLPFNESRHNGVTTAELPSSARIVPKKREDEFKKDPSQEIILALGNLVQLGCLRFALSWGGGEVYSCVLTTILGKSFFEACSFTKTFDQRA